jgi:phage terminase small subunit
MALTPKQEKFAQEYVATGNASEAYRRAYNVKPTTKDSSVHANASQLLGDTRVSQRVKQIKAAIVQRHELTIDGILDELEEAREMGKITQQSSSMVSASMGKAKLLGLIVDRKEITVHGMISAMTDDELGNFILEMDVDSDDYEDSLSGEE